MPSALPFNFNAGPSMLAPEVLRGVSSQFLSFGDSGLSIFEQSEHEPRYAALCAETAALLLELLDVPDSHRILFMAGGASAQTVLVPMNIGGPESFGDYVITGVWAHKAYEAACDIGKPTIAWDGRAAGYARIPRADELRLNPAAAYLHITSNNTAVGSQFRTFPDAGTVPLVVDASSDLLTRSIDLRGIGVLYGAAQKNLGPSGVTLIVIRESLLSLSAARALPSAFHYAAAAQRAVHGVPSFDVYLMNQVLRWMKAQGGLAAMEERNLQKARLLYRAIDESEGAYTCGVEPESRSTVNVVFRLPSAELEARFLEQAGAAGFVGLKNHAAVGGIRASLYNALPIAAVEALVQFMRAFRVRMPGSLAQKPRPRPELAREPVPLTAPAARNHETTGGVRMNTIAERLSRVRERIHAAARAAARDPDRIRLVAVSKYHTVEAILQAYAEGQRDFGENYAQELAEKAARLRDLQDVRFRFVGGLQRNKAKLLISAGCAVESIASLAQAEALSERAAAAGACVDVMIQINPAGEAQKSGAAVEDVTQLVTEVRALPALSMKGLMVIPPAADEERARACYRAARALAEHLELPELSMGMSDDLELAIAEGSTSVRIGTAIFGPRPIPVRDAAQA